MAFTSLFSHLFKETVNSNALPMAKIIAPNHFHRCYVSFFLLSTSQDEMGPIIKAAVGFLYTCKRLALVIRDDASREKKVQERDEAKKDNF